MGVCGDGTCTLLQHMHSPSLRGVLGDPLGEDLDGPLGAVFGGRLRGAGGGALAFTVGVVKFSAEAWALFFTGDCTFSCSAASRRSSIE